MGQTQIKKRSPTFGLRSEENLSVPQKIEGNYHPVQSSTIFLPILKCSEQENMLENHKKELLWRPKVDISEEEIARNLAKLTKDSQIHLWKPHELEEDVTKFSDQRGLAFDSLINSIKKNPNTYEELVLDFEWVKEATDEDLEIITKHIFRKQQHLKRLKLAFCNSYKLTDQGIKHLAKELRNTLLNLESLSLTLPWFTRISYVSAEPLLEAIFQKVHLKKLHLQIGSSITDKLLHNMVRYNKRSWSRITDLSIGFANCRHISTPGLRSLGKIIAHRGKDLENLTLDLSLCRFLNHQSIDAFFEEVGSSLKTLKQFSLKISLIRAISSLSVTTLAKYIGNQMPSLEKLLIHFEHCTCIGLIEFEDLLKKLHKNGSKIKSLSIRVMSNFSSFIDDQDLQSFGQSLLTFGKKRLEELDLLFSGYQMTNVGVSNFSKNCLCAMGELKKLSIGFRKCTSVHFNGNGVADLIENISYFIPTLKSLDLDFSENEQIDDQGLFKLKKSFGYNLQSLEKLSINFSRCYNLNNWHIRKLTKGLSRNLPSLTNLTLKFNNCSGISYKGYEAVFLVLGQHSKKLKTLHVSFGKDIYSKALINTLVSKALKNVSSLEEFYLNEEKAIIKQA